MYQLTINECIIRLSDGACIPQDESNTDYQTYLQWKAEGNEPLPIEFTELIIEQNAVSAINSKLDEIAKQIGYDNIIDACSFYSSTNSEYKQDAINLISLRDKAWEYYHSVQDELNRGKIKIDTIIDWMNGLIF